MSDISTQRREYGTKGLMESDLPDDPLVLFQQWLDQAIASNCIDPTAFVLASISGEAPDARVVLLKEATDKGFVFFTNYQSAKGRQLAINPKVAACFYWAKLSRQVRIMGTVEKLPQEENAAYFKSRPILSQRAALISPQSEAISSRQWLEDKMSKIEDQTLECPDYWGGYIIRVKGFEFFQGRDSRLHDRFLSLKDQNNTWSWQRLAP